MAGDGPAPVQGEGPDGRGGPHVFVDDVERPILDDRDRHHFDRVLRLRAGDRLTVSDGRGSWRACRWDASERPEPTGPVIIVVAPRPALTVAFALVKGGRPELVVQKLTELGIDAIRPFAAERSVVRLTEEKWSVHAAKWATVAREASMQSRRCHLPQVVPIRTFDEVVVLPQAVRAERGGDPPGAGLSTVLVGPEGGWSRSELQVPLPLVDLGPNVLRAETASIAAATLMVALRRGTVRPAVGHSATGSEEHPP